MLKHFDKIPLLIISFIIINSLCFAAGYNTYEDRLYYDREEFSENEEGKLLFKLRAQGIFTTAKQSGLPAPTSGNTPASIGKLFSYGLGIDTATTFYFTNNIAAELSLGVMFMRNHPSVLRNIVNNYHTPVPDEEPLKITRKDIFLIPITATAIYNIAPYGGIQPYVGAGMHATYIFNKFKNTKIKHGFGPVIQVGVDLVAKDYTFINIDVKQYFFSPKIRYSSPMVDESFSSKLKLDQVVISFGVGFKF